MDGSVTRSVPQQPSPCHLSRLVCVSTRVLSGYQPLITSVAHLGQLCHPPSQPTPVGKYLLDGGGSRIGGAGCWPKDLSGPGLAPQDSASPALGEELIRLTTFRGPWGDPDFGALVVLSGKRPQSWPGKAPVHGLYRELRETSEHCRALASRQELLRPMSGSSLCGGRSGPDGPAQRPGPQHARVIVNGVTVQGGTVGGRCYAHSLQAHLRSRASLGLRGATCAPSLCAASKHILSYCFLIDFFLVF